MAYTWDHGTAATNYCTAMTPFATTTAGNDPWSFQSYGGTIRIPISQTYTAATFFTSPSIITTNTITITGSTFIDTQWWNQIQLGGYTTIAETPEERQAREEKEAVLVKKRQVATRRAEELLVSLLSAEQLETYRAEKRFDVVLAGKIYRLRPQQTVKEIDASGKEKVSYCIHPSFDHGLPAEDVLIAQKMLLETNFKEFERIANATRLAA